jgi:hypothetical protein
MPATLSPKLPLRLNLDQRRLRREELAVSDWISAPNKLISFRKRPA